MKFPSIRLLTQPVIALAMAATLHAAASDGTLETLADEVKFTASDGTATAVQVCTDRTIHVTSQPKGAPEFRPSYVVIQKWGPVKFTVSQEDPAAFMVRTAELQVKLDRKTGAVSFFDLQGKPLLGEQGHEFTPAMVNKENTFQVQQAFGYAPDEAIFGLGQHQDGLWNWRGLPVELQQQNTCVAIPFLVSTKGYGLLWDNASRTTVNPVDQKIELTEEDPSATAGPDGQPKATEDLVGKDAKKAQPLAVRHGTLTTEAAGEYVFFARNGDRKDEFSILVDGKPVASVVNMWTPYTVTGTVTLPAQTTVNVTLRGGGKAPELGARLRETGRTVFRSAVGDGVNYTFFYGPEIDQIIDGYRTATGAVPMLPRWAFGFWQCRERYGSQQEVLDAARKYRELKIPLDVIVQDWIYWGKYGWGSYQFDESKYPDPAGMIKELHDMHVKFMISVWPNPNGEAKADLQAIPHGFIGSYYDVYNPEARRVRWSVINKNLFSIGTDAWWQDAAEPGDEGTAVYGHETYLGSGDRDALAYPLFHTQGIYENQRATNPEKRVVNLTRSSYAGEQRYGAIVWSGDIRGDWITFKRQIAAGLNFSLSGQPYWTTDSGGFFRPPQQYTDADYNEVQARWFEWSTFCPVQRIHGWHTKTEFWNWLPQTQQVLISYDQLRYRLLPYNYSLAWQVTHRNGTPMRPLVMDFPDDPRAVATSDEYLWGPAFLVAPVTEAKAVSWETYLPKGSGWIDFWTGKRSEGGTTISADAPLDKMPLRIRAGSIIPLGPDLQYAGEKPADPIELRVYPGADGNFTLYEDQGDSYRYENGAFATILLHWDDAGRRLVIGKREGAFPGMLDKRTFRVVIVSDNHGVGGDLTARADKVVSYDGAEVSVPAEP